jgi:hypothetical protein
MAFFKLLAAAARTGIIPAHVARQIARRLRGVRVVTVVIVIAIRTVHVVGVRGFMFVHKDSLIFD